MSSLFALWKRAPLWRFCLVTGTLALVLGVLFPAPRLRGYFPWLPMGFSVDSPGTMQNSGQTGSHLATTASSTEEKPQILYPDIDTTLEHYTILAGHQIPLPAGQWHPVLTASTNEHFPISFIALARASHHILTGLVIAETNLVPTPASLASTITQPCHDDRNTVIERHESAETAECILLEPALLNGLAVNDDNFINDSLARLRISGFIVPPFMIAASWRHLEIMPKEGVTPDQEPRAGFAIVDTLIPPLSTPVRQGQIRILAPLDSWQGGVRDRNPEVASFMKNMVDWLHNWLEILQQGYHHNLPDAPEINTLMQQKNLLDPMTRQTPRDEADQ